MRSEWNSEQATNKRVGGRRQTQQDGIIKSGDSSCSLVFFFFFRIGDKGNVIAALYFVAGSVTLLRPVAESACWVAGLPKRGVRTELFLNDFLSRRTKTRAGPKVKHESRACGQRASNPLAGWTLFEDGTFPALGGQKAARHLNADTQTSSDQTN